MVEVVAGDPESAIFVSFLIGFFNKHTALQFQRVEEALCVMMHTCAMYGYIFLQ